jgi:hypothetical protein
MDLKHLKTQCYAVHDIFGRKFALNMRMKIYLKSYSAEIESRKIVDT